MSFIAGLGSSSVYRLHQTMKLVKTKSVYVKYQALETLMRSERSYSNYRKQLKLIQSQGKAAVPYLGVFLRDLLYLTELGKNYQETHSSKDEFDVSRLITISDLIFSLTQFHGSNALMMKEIEKTINLTGIHAVKQLIYRDSNLSMEEAFDLSCRYEPKSS